MNKKEEKIDYGPLLSLKPELDLEKLKKDAFIHFKFLEYLIKNINAGMGGQRFAVNWGAEANQKMEIWLGATTSSTATPEQIEKVTRVSGHQAIVAKKDLPGIVHEQLAKMNPREFLYQGGLSFYIRFEKHPTIHPTIENAYNLRMPFTNHSTRQYESQNINKIAEMAWFFDFGHENGTLYDRAKNQFTHRKYNRLFKIERSSVMPITDLVIKTIVNDGLVKNRRCLARNVLEIIPDTSGCENYRFDKEWDENFRHNKDNLADALLTTICVACGYNDDEKPGPFWPKLTDREIVSKTMSVAWKNKIKIDLNKIPNQLKQLYGQDFSTTALMFAAKKRDMPADKCLSLVIFLTQNGADPDIKDNDGHDAFWYAQQAGNTKIAEYLSTLSNCQQSVKGNHINVGEFIKLIKLIAEYEFCRFSEESIFALGFIENNHNQFDIDISLKFLKKFTQIKRIIEKIERDFVKNLSKNSKKSDFINDDQYGKMISALNNSDLDVFLNTFDQLDFSGDVTELIQELKMIFDYTGCNRFFLNTAFEKFFLSQEKISGQAQNEIKKKQVALQFLIKEKRYDSVNMILQSNNDIKLTEIKLTAEDQYELLHAACLSNDEKVINKIASSINSDAALDYLIKNKYYKELTILIHTNGHSVFDLLVEKKHYFSIYRLIRDHVIELTDQKLTPELQKELFNAAVKNQDRFVIHKILSHIFPDYQNFQIDYMVQIVFQRSFNNPATSLPSASMIPFLVRIGCDYLFTFKLKDIDIFYALKALILTDQFKKQTDKWIYMRQLLSMGSNHISIGTQLIASCNENNKMHYYYPHFLLDLISISCGGQSEEKVADNNRESAALLLKQLFDKCKNIEIIISIVHLTEAAAPTGQKHPWDFLQKRRSNLRTTTFSYICENKTVASTTWTSIMAHAQDLIMELAKSAHVLVKDDAVLAFLRKQTRGLSLFSTSDSYGAEYTRLCTYKSLRFASVQQDVEYGLGGD